MLRQIIRITIEDRVLEGFTKYSKRIQGVPKARTSEKKKSPDRRLGPVNFRKHKPYWVALTEAT